ncbi:MAG: HEPN domain-containing protein [Candidatus Latescibacteria bacterium]|nr:HEPN domain-containing protein [Candidatus Latescibacterota bacterium]
MNWTRDKYLPNSPEEWLKHALSDLRYAKLGIEPDNILSQQICFHAQQAVEKSLKAILLFSNVDFPLTYDIYQLIDILKISGITLPSDFEDAGILTPYAVETRYPGYMTEITKQEVEKAIELAETITLWTKAYITDK